MKAIINQKRYDTDRAVLLGRYDNMDDVGNFFYISETLHKTLRSGAYFLAGEGNAGSRYAVSDGPNSRKGGEKITPMTEEEAVVWAQAHLAADEVEEIFPHLIEDA